MFQLVQIVFIAFGCEAAVRTWIASTNNSLETQRYDCAGLIYPESFTSVTTLDTRTINRIILPENGYVAFADKSRITFDPSLDECTEISINQDISFFAPHNWNPLSNRAIPVVDRIPCSWDNIVIPTSKTFGMMQSFPMFHVKSLKFFGEQQTQESVNDIRSTLLGETLSVNFDINEHNNCTRNTCACREEIEKDVICEYVESHVELFNDGKHCKNPILGHGTCVPICGVILVFNDNLIVKQDLLYMLAKETNIDYYYGLTYKKNFRGQIVIVDKEAETGGQYSHEALQRIKTFLESKHAIKYVYKSMYESLQILDFDTNDDPFIIMESGEPIITGRFWSSGIGILLLTLFVNLFIFVTIYVLFVSPVKRYDFRAFRMNPSTFRPFLFARFDNANDLTDDEEGEEVRGKKRIDIAFAGGAALNESTPSSSSSSACSLHAAECTIEPTNASFVHADTTEEQSTAAAMPLERYKSNECASSEFDNPLYGKQIAEDNLQEQQQEAQQSSNVPAAARGKKVGKNKSGKRKAKRYVDFEPHEELDEMPSTSSSANANHGGSSDATGDEKRINVQNPIEEINLLEDF